VIRSDCTNISYIPPDLGGPGHERAPLPPPDSADVEALRAGAVPAWLLERLRVRPAYYALVLQLPYGALLASLKRILNSLTQEEYDSLKAAVDAWQAER
jgi:hypothetical protein